MIDIPKEGIDCKGRKYIQIPLGKAVDIRGTKNGTLEVIFRAKNKETEKTKWMCACDCGNYILVSTHDFNTGHIKSCGCQTTNRPQNKAIDLTERVFGKLKVQYFAFINDNRAFWHCKCDCGNEKDISGKSLRRGFTKSCGCIQKEIASKTEDLTGKTFNKLCVLQRVESRNNKAMWLCKCLLCGNTIKVGTYDLKAGKVLSCGCLKSSLAVLEIKTLLEKNNISFLTEYTFSDLRSEKGKMLRFDFAIFKKDGSLSHLIEYDGEQHYRQVSSWGGKEELLQIQKRDKMKNEYCLLNNIPLIRIPYFEKNNITLERLLGKSVIL